MERIVTKLRALEDEPRPSGSIKLAGAGDMYRIRSGDYRIIDRIEGARAIVLVVDVGNRRDVYRHL